MELGGITILITADHTRELPARIAQIAPSARVLSRCDLQADASALEEVDVILGSISPGDLTRAERLKWVQCYSAGANWVQNDSAKSHPVVITNARIHASPVSEQLFGMLLMLTRCLHFAHQHKLAGKWQRPDTGQVRILAGMTLCVVGLGVIGRRCAELGAALGMEVIGVRQTPRPTQHVSEVFGPEDICQALSRADVIMNILPGTEKTAKLIGARELAAAKPGAILCNAGRGKTVDTDALVEALQSGKLAGACLDVTDPEPLPEGHPLWAMPNVIIAAHYGGWRPDYDRNVEELFLDNLNRFLSGQPLLNVVDKQEGY